MRESALTESCIAQVSLGYYEKEVDAARAYDAESLRLRGPNGHINLPESRTLVEARAPEMGTSQANSTGEPLLSAMSRGMLQACKLETLSLLRFFGRDLESAAVSKCAVVHPAFSDMETFL